MIRRGGFPASGRIAPRYAGSIKREADDWLTMRCGFDINGVSDVSDARAEWLCFLVATVNASLSLSGESTIWS